MNARTRAALVVLGGTALLAAGVVPAIAALTNPLANSEDNLGQSLLFMGTSFANVWCVLAGSWVVVAGLAVGGALGGSQRLVRNCVIVGAAAAFLTMDYTALAILGYVPMILGNLLVGNVEMATVLASPGLLVNLANVTAALSLVMWLLRDSQTKWDSISLAAATRRSRKWALIAMEAPALYALTRFLMFLQVPGFAGFSTEIALVGVGLGLAALGGAWLTWGLVAPWGERFPGWMPWIAGRRVPTGLAVGPALGVALLIGAASRDYVFLGMIVPGEQNHRNELLEAPLIVAPMFLWPLWAVALALAAVNYRTRRLLTQTDDSDAAKPGAGRSRAAARPTRRGRADVCVIEGTHAPGRDVTSLP